LGRNAWLLIDDWQGAVRLAWQGHTPAEPSWQASNPAGPSRRGFALGKLMRKLDFAFDERATSTRIRGISATTVGSICIVRASIVVEHCGPRHRKIGLQSPLQVPSSPLVAPRRGLVDRTDLFDATHQSLASRRVLNRVGWMFGPVTTKAPLM
jgi:hypothetical protein